MTNSFHKAIIYCLLLTVITITVYSCKKKIDYDGNRKFVSDPTIESREFVRNQGYINLAQLALAQLTLTRTNHDSIKILSEQILKEHTKAQKDLVKVAKSERMKLPDTLDFFHKLLIEKLSKLNGYNFDTAYITSQVKEHQKILKDLQYEIKHGNDEENLIYANKYFPYYQTHFNKLNKLKNTIQKEPQ